MKKNMIASSLVFFLRIIIQPSHLFTFHACNWWYHSLVVLYVDLDILREIFMRKMGNSFKWVGKGNRNISFVWKENISLQLSPYVMKQNERTLLLQLTASQPLTVATKVQREFSILFFSSFLFYLRWDLGLEYVCLTVSIYLFAFLFELCFASLVC